MHLERTDPTAPDIRLTVTRSNANPLSLDSQQHSFTDTIEKRPLPPSPLRRHHLREWTLFDYTKESTSAATVTVSWHNEDPTDYLAGGYWMHLQGDLATDAITGVELGVFIDGPEFAGTPTLPVMGTATYRGRAAGLYTYFYGPMWQALDPRLTDGLQETGEYSAVITLTADFGASTLQGCFACVENMETTGVTLDAEGNRSTLYTPLSLGSIKFAPTPILPDGTFTGTGLSIVLGDPVIGVSLPVTNVQGSWDGQFSSRPATDGSGDPRLVGGTSGVQWDHPDGSRGEFVGYFFATKTVSE